MQSAVPPLKILHCPTTVGGNPQGLARAERALGQDSRSMTLAQNYFNYPADEVVLSSRDSLLMKQFKRWRAVFRSLTQYDVIHYNFGQSLCPQRLFESDSRHPAWLVWLYNVFYASWAELLDVVLARRLGRVTAVMYQGDDARQGDYCRAHYPIHFCHESGVDYFTASRDAVRRRRIVRFARNVDFIYAVNPDLMNILPARAKFVPYACVDPRDWRVVTPAEAVPAIPHIVHAPSNRLVKGSRYVIAAFERLQAEGIPFRYTLVEGISHDEARRIFETADLLVDQLLAGFYGGLAVELMALGKPVICYMRQEDFRHLPEKMRADLPLIDATPDTIYDVLKTWLTTRKPELRGRGLASRAFVEAWHDPEKIAAGLIEDYRQALRTKKMRWRKR